ncbi:MAG: thioesterase family protein [Polyangiaceae bacterium]
MNRAFESSALAGAVETSFAERRLVRFQDVDAAGIVFYPRVLEYMSDVYVAFLHARGLNVPKSIEAGAYLIPLVHAEADYMAPMRFGDPILVEVIGVHLGKTSFQVGYRVRHEDGRVAAVGQTAHVTVGLPEMRPIPIPGELRAALENKMV